ncbi:DUF6264 family protein [Curtobacterium sp. Curtsp57]|uniref:DUF6264 family protein n=1 Tax=Curtobacterium sp. Curtsp57 TaxID=3243047 RepID=UPI0039B4323A
MSAGDWSSVPSRGHGDGQEARLDPPTSAAGTADGRVHGRPAPQYGEYAPDGWVNPVFVEQERAERERQAHEAAVAARESAAAGPGPGAQPSRTSSGAAVPTSRFGKSPGDFLLTVMLLAFGLVSVVQSLSVGTVASGVRRELELRYTTLEDPGALTTAALVSAIVTVVLFVLVAWWSIVRLRRRKRTVWVPLLGGAVASLVTLGAFATVLANDGHFVAWMMQNAGG